MTKGFNKDQIETIILKTIMARDYTIIGGNKVYNLNKEGEEIVVQNLKGNKEVGTLSELEEAMNNPNVKNVYIPKFAAITSKGLTTVLNRTSISKDIYCAFEVQE
jgi:hypothetical protein